MIKTRYFAPSLLLVFYNPLDWSRPTKMKGREFKPNNEQSQQVRSLVSRHIDQLAIETHCIDLLTCRSQLQCLALLEYQLSMITLMNPIYR